LRIWSTRSDGIRNAKETAMEISNLGVADGLPPVDWDSIVAKLDTASTPEPNAPNSRTTWLATVNEDGSPHVTAVGALWVDGAYWFQTGAGTRKCRNVARDPRCSVALSVSEADVVVEGDAVRVTEHDALARIAKAWADQGWPAEPDASGAGVTAPFNAPSQGPPPWHVYRIDARSARDGGDAADRGGSEHELVHVDAARQVRRAGCWKVFHQRVDHGWVSC
jgi:hypothetical protein